MKVVPLHYHKKITHRWVHMIKRLSRTCGCRGIIGGMPGGLFVAHQLGLGSGRFAFAFATFNLQRSMHANISKKHGVCFWENRILHSGQAMCFVVISAQLKYAPGRKRKQLFGVLIETSGRCFRLGQILHRRLLIPVLKHLRELFDDWS